MDMIWYGYLIFWLFEEWISNIHTAVMGTFRQMKNLCRKLAYTYLIHLFWMNACSFHLQLCWYAMSHCMLLRFSTMQLAIYISSFLLDDPVLLVMQFDVPSQKVDQIHPSRPPPPPPKDELTTRAVKKVLPGEPSQTIDDIPGTSA